MQINELECLTSIDSPANQSVGIVSVLMLSDRPELQQILARSIPEQLKDGAWASSSAGLATSGL